METYDVIVIGGGPGGYHSSGLLAEQGKSVLLIEKEALGGTCLNWGCIPTKTLLNLAKQCSYSHELREMGLEGSLSYKHELAMKWKNKVVSILQTGIAGMMKKEKVVVVEGRGTIVEIKDGDKIVKVHTKDNAEQMYRSKNIILASGVESIIPPIHGIDTANPLTSKEVLNISSIPETLAIIGGGVIGIEMAALFGQLGSKVTVIEAMSDILPMMESEGVKIIKAVLQKDFGIVFHCNASVTSVKKNSLSMKGADGKESSINFETLLVSTGRRADLSAFEAIGLRVSKTGIVVQAQMETNIPGIYAIGDIAGIHQLAHVAYRMGEVAVNAIMGKPTKMRYNAIPSVVYTNPEMASCGLTEDQAKERGYDIVSASLPMIVSGRVIAEHGATAKGMCKIIANKANGVVLGIHLVAPTASEIIAVASVIIEAELQVKELVEIILPHPTAGEVIHNVSLALANKLYR